MGILVPPLPGAGKLGTTSASPSITLAFAPASRSANICLISSMLRSIRHGLDRIAMLDLVFAGHQQDKQFQKYRRLVPHHLLYRLATALPEGGVHFPDGVGVKRMTRAMDVAGLCKNDRCLWPREGFSAANVLTPEQQPQALKSDSCVVAGRAVEDAEAGPKKTRA